MVTTCGAPIHGSIFYPSTAPSLIPERLSPSHHPPPARPRPRPPLPLSIPSRHHHGSASLFSLPRSPRARSLRPVAPNHFIGGHPSSRCFRAQRWPQSALLCPLLASSSPFCLTPLTAPWCSCLLGSCLIACFLLYHVYFFYSVLASAPFVVLPTLAIYIEGPCLALRRSRLSGCTFLVKLSALSPLWGADRDKPPISFCAQREWQDFRDWDFEILGFDLPNFWMV